MAFKLLGSYSCELKMQSGVNIKSYKAHSNKLWFVHF